jgi:hypothetical protein
MPASRLLKNSDIEISTRTTVLCFWISVVQLAFQRTLVRRFLGKSRIFGSENSFSTPC